MGYNAYSYAVFGKEVSENDLTVVTKVRGCSHEIATNQKFCSECGNPVWKQEKEFIAPEGYGRKLGFFNSSADSEYGILGFRLAKTNSSDKEYYPIPAPTPAMALEILEFFKMHNIECSEEQLKTYLYTRHIY